MNPTIIFVVVALAAGTSANPWGWGAPQPPRDNPDVAHAKAAHLAEVARQNGAALSALAAANARAGAWAGPAPVAWAGPAPVIVQAAPQPPQDNPDVAIAKAAHLAEVARQNGAALSALAAANARAAVAPQAVVAVQAAPQAPSDNPDVAIAKAAHLAEHARQTGNALAALSGVRVVAAPVAWAPAPVVVQAAPQAPSDTVDVAIAKAAHLAEVARQNGAALSALAAAQARAGWGGWGAPYYG